MYSAVVMVLILNCAACVRLFIVVVIIVILRSFFFFFTGCCMNFPMFLLQSGDGESTTVSKPPASDTAADTTTEADDTSTAAAAAAPPSCLPYDDTDSCHTGQMSGGGRRGSAALSGVGNVSSTVITVTEPSPCQSPERSVAQSREEDVKEWVRMLVVVMANVEFLFYRNDMGENNGSGSSDDYNGDSMVITEMMMAMIVRVSIIMINMIVY